MTTRVAILISGGGSNMVALADSMQQSDHPGRPVLVMANSADAKGLKHARARGIATASVDHREFAGAREAFDHALDAQLNAHDVEFVCLAGFMRVLGPQMVSRWHGRMINIHPSLLPKYPGLNTHARALAAGDQEAGCTVHEVTPELDAGPILGQARVPVMSNDTPEELAARVLAVEHVLYPRVLRAYLAGERMPVG